MSKFLPIILFVFLYVGSQAKTSSNFRTVKAGIPVSPADSLALVALYNATSGSGWFNEGGKWGVGNVSGWYGVTQIADRVVGIALQGNNLNGIIPPEIGNLTALTNLTLSSNKLTSALPVEFQNLTSLSTLDLSNNQLSGSIPTIFNSLVNLTDINLSNNQFSGAIPANILSATGLTNLDLSYNQLTGEVPNFSALAGLSLSINNNKLSILPDMSAGSFSQFNISNNNFTFEDLEPNKGISVISFSPQNPFSSPADKNSSAGQSFSIAFSVGGSANHYQWYKGKEPIPDATLDSYTIANLSLEDAGVYSLRVTNDNFGELILSSGDVVLRIANTNIPDSLAVVALYNSTSGNNWVDHTNWLSGNVDTWNGLEVNSGRVVSISLGNNKLNGSLPVELGDLKMLTYLDLGSDVVDGKSTDVNRNSISGTVPDALGNLTNLTYLNLSSNDLGGTLPSTFGNLTQLETLWLSGNNFTLGNFPSSLLNLGTLQFLKLSNCGITGSIPSQITNLTRLTSLILNDNKLTDLPDLTALMTLTDLRVANNMLTFEDLEPNAGITSLSYSPQDSVGIKLNVVRDMGSSYTFTSSVGGTVNQYQWKKNTVAIAGASASTYTIPSLNFSDEGNYIFVVTSSLLPDLTLFGRSVSLKVSSLKNDSLALVQVYNATKGSSWNNKTGWLSSNLSTWNGVTISANRVTAINLSGNNLDGNIPTAINDLASVKTIDVSNNKITSLPAITGLAQLTSLFVNGNLLSDLPNLTSLMLLTDLRVANNKLTFEDLEPNIGVGSISYVPQDSVGVKSNLFLETGISHTFTTSVAGTANQYKWKKNAVVISGASASSYVLSAPDFVDEGTYTFEVTSSLVPGLTLFGRPVILKVSSLKRDSLALVQVYNATKGTLWTNKAGWLSGKLSTWNGVTIATNRVTAVNLSNNNLDGSLPTAFNDLVSLKTVDLSNNRIISLPVMSLTQLTTMNVSGNKLDFASLESNPTLLSIMNYAKQADVGTIKLDSISAGSTYPLSVVTAGTNNKYQWKRNGTSVSGATSNSYTVPALGRTTSGEYHCEVTNTIVPGLIIKSASQTVVAVTDLSGKLVNQTSAAIAKGKVSLFRIAPKGGGGYDTVRVVNVNSSGAYTFKRVALDNYKIMGFADTVTYTGALPTYYKSTPFWEEGDTLVVNNTLSNLDIISQFKPTNTLTGTGVISGIVQKNDGTGGGRTEATPRVSGAGVSCRRVENNGRSEGISLTLIASVFTNKDGEFEFKGLPLGNYRLNVQYPGYPMDETSYINIPIGNGSPIEIKVEATIETTNIVVRQVTITAVPGQEGYKMSAYPNPTHEFITLQFDSPSATRNVEVVDGIGRKLKTVKADDVQISIDVRTLENGMYFLNVRDKDASVKTFRVSIE